MWLGAVIAGMASPVLGGMLGWRVQPAHFAERHGRS